MAETDETTTLLHDNQSHDKLVYTGGACAVDGSKKYEASRTNASINNSIAHEDSLMVYPESRGTVYSAVEVLSDTEERNESFLNSDTHPLLATDGSSFKPTASNMQTLMHLIKGNIGTGILALPVAFKHGGLWTSLAGILCIGVIAVHCMHILVKCSRKLSQRTGSFGLDYADVAEICLKTGPRRLRPFSKCARLLVNFFLMCTQFGFCCVYIVFVASNIHDVISHFHKGGPNLVVCEVIVTAALIPYICVRSLKTLAPFSTFANILSIISLVIIIQFIVQDLPNSSERASFTSFKEIPLFFGTAIFAIEGIGLVLPLENNIKRREDFGGFAGIINLGMVTIVCFYAAIGFYGYLKFGDAVLGSVTLSLPEDKWLYITVRLMYALAIFISYNIQFYVPISILWPKIKRRLNNEALRNYGEFPFRIVLVLITFVIAVGVPYLDQLTSLVGAFSSSAISLIIPVIIELVTLSADEEHLPKYIIVKNILIFLFGITGCVLGTFVSIKEIVEAS